MSSSLLYHCFGLYDQEYIKTEYHSGCTFFHIRTKWDKLQCSECNSFKVIKKGTIQRTFRTVPIGLKPTYLIAQIQRLKCKECGALKQERIRFADKKKAIPVDLPNT